MRESSRAPKQRVDFETHQSQGFSYEAALREYRIALTTLRALGLSLAPNSRLARYETLVDSQVHAADCGILRLRRQSAIDLTLITREIGEISLIADAIPDRPSRALLERLRLLSRGELVPDEEHGSPSREAQFELSIWAKSRASHFPAQVGKPDIRLHTSHGMLGIEAKRPASLRRLDDALRDAAGQLEHFQGTRLVAIQLDHALRPPRGWFEVQQDWQLLERTKQAYEWLIDQYGHLAFKRCLPKGVTAVLYSLTSPGWVHGINAPSVFNASFVHVLTDRDSHAYWAVREWAEAIGKRVD